MFTYYQEAKSEEFMKAFEVPVEKTVVLRGGMRRDINIDRLVVGDIVDVKFGDKIPADIRIISCSGFKVDNSSLTGESEPRPRYANSEDPDPLESKNLAFFATDAVEGFCTGVVLRTGDRTMMGHIAQLTGTLNAEKTPLSSEINLFVTFITTFAVTIGVIFFILAVAKGSTFPNALIYLIGIITANVPEGLLPTLTVCLTLAAQRMKARKCLFYKLEAVETLGSISVICTDKTGTLTANKMAVAHLWYDGAVHDAHCMEYSDLSTQRRPQSKGWEALSMVIGLCSNATFKENQGHIKIMDRKCNGDCSESALLKFYELEVGSVTEFRDLHTKVFEIPFNSSNKYQVSIHEWDDESYVLVIKGAPETVIKLCSSFLDRQGKEESMHTSFSEHFTSAHDQLASQGERVLAFAHKHLDPRSYPQGYVFDPEKADELLQGLCFAGLVSLFDPPRGNVSEAIAKCRMAGIKVIMVTGDHPNTAKAIGRAVGIISPGVHTADEMLTSNGVHSSSQPQAIVIHGADLANMTDSDIEDVLHNYSEIIFARTSPTQKLRIVEGCQRAGLVVAVTGDGVNDAPALRKAHIGIAMGITGTEVAKQVADMILLDDNFASIVSAIEEGRLLFDNLKKTISYALTANIPELTPFLFFILAGIPLPIGPIALVLICIGSDITPAISLAYEKAESNIMQRPPRNPKTDRLASHKLMFHSYAQIGMIESAAGFLTYFVVMGESGFMPSTLLGLSVAWNDPTANVQDSFGQDWTYDNRKSLEYTCYTAFFVSIVVSQWVNLIVCKTRRNSIFKHGIQNYYTVFALMAATCVAVFLTYFPVIGEYLSFREIRIDWWVVSISFSLLIFTYDELRKHFIRQWKGTTETLFLY
ncbi:hypothetical protein EMCRGX_G011866 [Ephydatia muelleri]